MSELRLKLPAVKWVEGLLASDEEMDAIGEDPERIWTADLVRSQPEAYVQLLLDRRTRTAGPMVPATEFWMIDADGYAGRLDLRHELNDKLRLFGGHIGYDVRPSRRRRGYGTLALYLGLDKAREFGLDRVLVTCDELNLPSRKIIEANGGVLEDAIETPFRSTLTCRYWIDLT